MAFPIRNIFYFLDPPGTGKSSTILALASHYNLNIYSFPHSSSLECGRFEEISQSDSLKWKKIFDDLFGGWRNTKARYSFSDFLNLLDGGTSGENAHLMFFTTNHRRKLDPALLRPGRCGDTILEFGYADPHQIKSMMKSYFPETSREEIQHFIDSVKHLSVTPVLFFKKYSGGLEKTFK